MRKPAQKSYSYVYFATTKTDSTTYSQTDMTDEEKAAVLEQATAVASASDLESGAEAQSASVSTGNYGQIELQNAEKYKEYSAALEEDSNAADDYEDAVVNYSGLDYTVLQALEGMSVGQTSDVIEVEGDGYYIVRLDSTFDESATETEKQTLLTERKEQAYDDLLRNGRTLLTGISIKHIRDAEFSDYFEKAETTDSQGTDAE